ncbi:MAG: hypothetical protein ACRDWF_04980 [Acidimicrobiia bacterium]|jgi:hypothetical protein
MSDEFLPDANPDEPPEQVRAPFSFKLMIALTVAYLGWRLVQGIVWVVERLS